MRPISEAPTFLGIDIGTHQTKVVLVDDLGHMIDVERSSHTVDYPHPGWAEHSIQSIWWDDLAAASQRLAARNGAAYAQLVAVGSSAIGPALAPVSESGVPERAKAILYGVDTRASAEIEQLRTELGDKLLSRTGNDLSSQSVGPKILWLKHHELETFKRAERFVTATSFVVQQLTGKWFIDHLTAAMWTPLYDFANQRWAKDMDWLVDPSRLASLAWATDIVGVVEPGAAAATSIPEGVQVICGTVDAAAEAVSVGVRDVGDVMLMYGSTAFLLAVSENAAPCTGVWSTPYLEPRSSAALAGMSTSGALTRWMVKLAREGSGGPEPDFAQLAARAGAIPAGSDGLLVLPYFSGERSPIDDPGARGVIAGLTLRHGFDHLYRAVLESVGFGIRHMLEEINLGPAGAVLKAVGGGSDSTHWPQIVSDITGLPQLIPETSLGASLGGAMMAAVGSGHLSSLSDTKDWVGPGRQLNPDPATKPLYDRRFEQYKELYRSTRPLIGELSSLAGEP